MKRVFLLMLLTMPIVLSGCANPVNLHTAQKYFDAGAAAERSGNYPLAHENYSRAYINIEIGSGDEQAKALVMYNLGRMKGYLCMKAEAEPLLLNSMLIEEKAANQNTAWYTGRLVEIAHFYQGYEEFAKAIPYFEKATLRLVDSGVEQTDPIEMADIWDDYALTLRRAGFEIKANEARERAKLLRKSNSGKIARFTPFPYGKNCKTSNKQPS